MQIRFQYPLNRRYSLQYALIQISILLTTTNLIRVENMIGIEHMFNPTRCRDLRLKQFCLEDIAPAILIILIAHIIIAVRWMLI